MKLKKVLTGFVAAAMLASATIYTSNNNSYIVYDAPVYAAEALSTSSNLSEAAYITWAPISGADGYNVYVKQQGGSYTQIDSMLVRQYSGYFRADAVGLKAGSYVMKVVPTTSGKEDASKAMESSTIAVKAHDREGFAFANGKALGAYNADGTLKSDAVVVYVTNENKDTVTCELNALGDGNVICTGVQEIITAYKKGKETRPIAIRFIGNIEDPAGMPSGDLYCDGVTAGMTLEGIGNDTTLNGFGIVIKNSSNIEIRNFGFMNCDSKEGDSVGLQQSNTYCWVHNCDFFYGLPGSDADQVKGDGALDTKKSQYVTHSYNHFWDTGKTHLNGNGDTTLNYITYHHNWYDHSDSRHPLVRVSSAVHCYNNFYDGVSKYGMIARLGSSIFAESNYFKDTKSPILISQQGTDIASGDPIASDDGGMIKSYGNVYDNTTAPITHKDSATNFDCYEASSATEQVPSSYTTVKGGTSYSNFDTSSDMYDYTADNGADVPTIVQNEAGRIDGGDFDWDFSDPSEDTNSTLISGLSTALKAYDDKIIAIGSGFKTGSEEPVVTTPVVTTPVVTTPVVTTTAKTTTSKTTTIVTVPIIPIETSVTIDTSNGVIFCAPYGDSSADGSMDNPMDVLTALSKVQPGGTIYMLQGTYEFDSTVKIDNTNNGTAGKYKTLAAYPGADVKWDFSAMATDPSNRGLVHDGDYWHLKGFEIAHAGDNGCLLSGSNNIFELMVFTDNQDTGLQISRYNTSDDTIDKWPSNNKILNCTSKNNCDDATMENADGFAAKLTCGEGNVFDGCMAYNNSDDGWDLFAKEATGPIGVVTLRNCVAFRNGFTEYGEGFGGCDGNGFKLGGSGVGSAHVVENCLAFENLNCGFTDNNNPKLGSITNCTAYNNGMGGNGKPNFSCYRCTDDGCDFKNVITYINSSRLSASFPGGESTEKIANDKFVGTIENSIYYNSKYYFQSAKSDIANGGKIGENITPTDDMFVSLDVAPYTKVAAGSDSSFDFHTQWRNADGSVNTHGFLEIKEDSTYNTIGAKFDDNGSVITPSVKGDVNADGNVNAADAVDLEKFLTRKSTTVTKAYDVDENGKVNVFDFVTLKRILTK